MSIVAVHQFHSGTAVGDAITDQMVRLQGDLRRLGYASQIYAEHIHPDLASSVRHYTEYQHATSTLMLVHHSMGHDAFDDVVAWQTPIVTVYHNITPPAFFDDRSTRSYAQLGRAQLSKLAQRSLFGIADSNYNRRDMLDAGFERVDVLPVRTDFSGFRRSPVHGPPSDTSEDWLFVGRLVPNKQQHRLVEAFATYRKWFGVGHLHLVGDLSYHPYVDVVRAMADEHQVGDHVTLHGKVSDRELVSCYHRAGAFVCLSEHEGFGIPLLEAMAANVPVIAARSSAIAETLGGAGVLLDTPTPEVICHTARLLAGDPDVSGRLVRRQARRLERLASFDVDAELERVVRRAEGAIPDSRTIQIEGPFETSYSLATLNRELALAFDRRGLDVTLRATEGYGDYVPNDDDLGRHPRAAELHRAAASVLYPDVSIRQMHPARVDDSTAALTFQYFGWEESRLPASYVADFNQHLDGIGAMSGFVRDILRDNGVTVPIQVVGVGVEMPDVAARFSGPEAASIRGHCFLHISSAFPRKGIDVLLRAYSTAFDGNDDTTLVLKTFPNPHNDVERQMMLLHASIPNPPHVVWIDRDLSREEINGLYALADTYVHPARGEGFGLPVAEAMLARVPVISPASTGLADFVDESTAAVIPHTRESAHTHVSSLGSEWAEPDLDALVSALRAAADGSAATERNARLEVAHDRIRSTYTWAAVADRWANFIEEVERTRPGLSVTAITTYNSRCGIAEYSAHLYRHMRAIGSIRIIADRSSAPVDPLAETDIERVWDNYRARPLDDLLDAIRDDHSDVIHIHHNFGFYSLRELGRVITLATKRAPVVLTLHRTASLATDEGDTESLDQIVDELNRCATIVVHQEFDEVALRDSGVVTDVRVIPVGTDLPRPADTRRARRRHGLPTYAFVVAAYGFLLPHKRFTTLVEAVAELRRRGIDAFLLGVCALHPDLRSPAYLVDVKRTIERLAMDSHVRLVTEFLADEASKDLLAAADIVALPYASTDESASAAARSVLPVCAPIVTSTARIFDDIRGCVEQVDSPVDPLDLADTLESLWRDPERRLRLSAAVRRQCVTDSWQRVAALTRTVYLDAITARRSQLASDVDATGTEALATDELAAPSVSAG
jgi:glycosyltransferase involved in cell wall biosynthesis